MVFISRIEVFVAKPVFRFSFVVNSFHKDLFSEGAPRGFAYGFPYVRKKHFSIFGRQPGHSWQGPFFCRNNIYPIF